MLCAPANSGRAHLAGAPGELLGINQQPGAAGGLSASTSGNARPAARCKPDPARWVAARELHFAAAFQGSAPGRNGSAMQDGRRATAAGLPPKLGITAGSS